MGHELKLHHCLAISLLLHFVGALAAPYVIPPRPRMPQRYFRVRIVSEATPPAPRPTPAPVRRAARVAPVGQRASEPAPGRAGREGASRSAAEIVPPPQPVARRGSDHPPAPVDIQPRRATTPGLPEAPPRREIDIPSLAPVASLAPAEGLAVEPETDRLGPALAPPPGVGTPGPADTRGAPQPPATRGEGAAPRGSPTGSPAGGRPDGAGTGARGFGRGGGSAPSGTGGGSGGTTTGPGSGGSGRGGQAAPTPAVRGPVLVFAPPMPRTREMQRLEIHGHVRVRVSVNANGEITSATLVSRSGYPEIDAAAVRWVRAHWRFKPAMVNGKPTAGTAVVAVRF